MAALDLRLERLIPTASHEAGLGTQSKRCPAIEGVGLLTVVALNMAFLHGSFRNGDALIAVLGLDVQIKESGRYCGKRTLTKQGDAQVRRLLHNAAMPAVRTKRWRVP